MNEPEPTVIHNAQEFSRYMAAVGELLIEKTGAPGASWVGGILMGLRIASLHPEWGQAVMAMFYQQPEVPDLRGTASKLVEKFPIHMEVDNDSV